MSHQAVHHRTSSPHQTTHPQPAAHHSTQGVHNTPAPEWFTSVQNTLQHLPDSLFNNHGTNRPAAGTRVQTTSENDQSPIARMLALGRYVIAQTDTNILVNQLAASIAQWNGINTCIYLQRLADIGENDSYKTFRTYGILEKLHLGLSQCQHNGTNTLIGPIKLQFYKLLHTCVLAYFLPTSDGRHVPKNHSTAWKETLEQAIMYWRDETVQRHEVDRPYIHEYLYYLTCAKIIVDAISDTSINIEPIDIVNVATIVGSYFHLCQSKGHEVLAAAFQYVKRLYEQYKANEKLGVILELYLHKAQCMQLMAQPHSTEKQKQLIDHKKFLAGVLNTQFAPRSTPQWEIVYACVDLLDTLLRCTDDIGTFREIMSVRPDLDKLSEIPPQTEYSNQWCVHARVVTLCYSIRDKTRIDNAHGLVNTDSTCSLTLQRLKSVVTALDPRVANVLDTPPLPWNEFYQILTVLQGQQGANVDDQLRQMAETFVEMRANLLEATQQFTTRFDAFIQKMQADLHDIVNIQYQQIAHNESVIAQLQATNTQLHNYITQIEGQLSTLQQQQQTASAEAANAAATTATKIKKLEETIASLNNKIEELCGLVKSLKAASQIANNAKCKPFIEKATAVSKVRTRLLTSTYTATIYTQLKPRFGTSIPLNEIFVNLTVDTAKNGLTNATHISSDILHTKVNPGNHVLIMGNQGSGKTTLTRQIVYSWRNNTSWQQFELIFVFDIQDVLSQHTSKIAQLITKKVINPDTGADNWEETLGLSIDANKKVLFVLDDNGKEISAEEIVRLANTVFQHHTIILLIRNEHNLLFTNRQDDITDGVNGKYDGFKGQQFRLLGFDAAQMNAYKDKLGKYVQIHEPKWFGIGSEPFNPSYLQKRWK